MKIGGKHYRTIWLKEDEPVIQIIDQRKLPHEFVIEDLHNVDEVATAIRDMHVRGAGLIGATAGYGMYLAAREAPNMNPNNFLNEAAEKLKSTRPTAVNLAWAVDRQLKSMQRATTNDQRKFYAISVAEEIAHEDAEYCRRIGEHGVKLIERISERKNGEPVNISTHCNAGWLAFVDYGSATAPIYAAHDKGIKVHVWVDETRPRNQGASLTAYELGEQGVPHTVVVDNVGGHLMQHGLVDIVITGADRVTFTGDVANKIGTYQRALTAADNNVPFYVAFPSSTFDWETRDGVNGIHIEQRNQDEVRYIYGRAEDGSTQRVLLTPGSSSAANYAFDVTPRRLVTGLITERGICKAEEESILSMYPERRK